MLKSRKNEDRWCPCCPSAVSADEAGMAPLHSVIVSGVAACVFSVVCLSAVETERVSVSSREIWYHPQCSPLLNASPPCPEDIHI